MQTRLAPSLMLTLAAMVAVAMPSATFAAPDQPQSIVVNATPDLDRQIKDFIRILSPAPFGQVGRFEATFCPKVAGLTERTSATVEQRLREVAQAAGVRVGKPACQATMLLIVTADKNAYFLALTKRRPALLDNVPMAQLRRLRHTPGQAMAWQVGGKIGQNGKLMIDDPGRPPLQYLGSTSRLTTPVRPIFDLAVVIVEARALSGLTTTQLADYAAVRALSGADPSRFALTNEPTVLRVIDAPADALVPLGLTRWDLGYLRGLYHAREFVNGPAQRSDIGKEMKAVLQPRQ